METENEDKKNSWENNRKKIVKVKEKNGNKKPEKNHNKQY